MASKPTIDECRIKSRDFLWIVQSGLLAMAAKARRSDPDRVSKTVVQYSGTGVFIQIDEAVRAAGRIPEDMTAQAAAVSFCDFWNPRDSSARREPPHWFARFGDESYGYTLVSKADQFLWTIRPRWRTPKIKQA